MTDEITPESTDAPVAADPTGQANPDPSLKIKELEQRLRGQDAKISALTKDRNEAFAKAAGLESGLIDADAALKAQLQAKDQELADLRVKAAALPKVTKFPNAARTLGENIAGVPDEVLADLEAQLSQAPATDENPKAKPNPVPSNPPDSDGSDLTGLSREQIVALIARTPGPFSN